MPVKDDWQEKRQRQANEQDRDQRDAHIGSQWDRHRCYNKLADDKVNRHCAAKVPFFSFKGQATDGALPVHFEPATKEPTLAADRTT